MISAWNLVWIVPLAAGFGFFIAALFAVNGGNNYDR